MRKALGSTLLTATLVGGMALPVQALPTTDSPSDRSGSTLSASSLSPAAAAALRPALSFGARSPAVVHVQRTLGVTPTSGYYGPLTRAAVKSLQKRSGLKVTGRVTKATWKVLLKTGSTPAKATTSPEDAAQLKPALSNGARGPAVVHVQRTLGVTPTSGYYGPLTRAAVRALQGNMGLKVTGRVTKATWKVLLTMDPAAARTAAVTSPEDAAQLKPTLSYGARSAAVVHIQRTLGVTPTSGYFGTLTRAAVRALQQQSGLTVTGRVEDATWTVLLAADGVIDLTEAADPAPAEPNPEESASAAPASESPRTQTPEEAAEARPTLRTGMGPGDPAVIYVQRYLRVSPTSGYFGRLTKAAVIAFQKGLGISPTGTVGPLTWAAIAAGRTPAAAQSEPTASAAPSASPTPTTPAAEFTPPANAEAAEIALAYATAQVGKRYVLGGNGPDVFDCSGLVQQAYLAAGIRLPRLASQQRFAGTRVSLDELEPGDLLYYQDGSSPRRGHISMYAGDGQAVEAANPRRGVRVRPLDEQWYADRFVAAVRIA